MASRQVLSAVEELSAIVSATPSLSTDDNACDAVEQIGRICLAETGLRDIKAIIPIIAEGSDCFCAILADAAGASLVATVTAGLQFLIELMEAVVQQEALRKCVLLALPRIWDTTYAIWRICSAAKIRACCADLLSQVAIVAARADRINDLAVAEVLSSLLADARRNVGKAIVGITIKQALYGFFGTMAHKAPMVANEFADSMFGLLRSELQKEWNAKEPKYGIIAGCLDGFRGLLHNFADSDKGSVDLDMIFSTCRKLIHISDAARYAMIFAALKLLTEHMDKFLKHLLADKLTYTEMYGDLKRWAVHTNSDARKLGFAALSVYLKQVSRSVIMHLEQGNNEGVCTSAFSFFMNEFNEKIKHAESPREMTVAVRGFGAFVAPSRILSTAAQNEQMLSEMLQKSEQTFFSSATEVIGESRLEHLPTFLDTLSAMVQDCGSAVPDAFLAAVQRLCSLVIQMFPQLGPHIQHTACQAVVKTVMVVARACPTANDFVGEIVYKGLRGSCLLEMPSDVDGLSSPPPAGSMGTKKSFSYKDYLPLWNKLCGCTYMKELLHELEASEVELQRTSKLIFDEFIKATIKMIDAMNLQLLETESEDDRVTVDLMPVDKRPANDLDFKIFFSLEQIVVDTMSRMNVDLVASQEQFCLQIMKLSEKNPLVSGFYRLLEVWFRRLRSSKPEHDKMALKDRQTDSLPLSAEASENQDLDEAEVKMEVDDDAIPTAAEPSSANHVTISFFMRNLLGRLQHFSDEVLISALQLLLNFPIYAVIDNLSAAMDAIVIALQAGKSYLPLAEAAVTTLRRWCFDSDIDRQLLQPYFSAILPVLDGFLRSTTLDVTERSKVVLGTGKGKTKRRSPVAVGTDQVALTKVRELTLSFLGDLGGKYNHLIVDGDFLNDVKNLAIAWDMVQHLQFSVPFDDMMLKSFYLDVYLPRVTELCLHSPDRPTKVAACELLHAITIILVGTHSEVSADKREKAILMDLINKLMPKILELACDVEPVTKQIFEPLSVQMVHWFSRTAQTASAEATAVLDCVMDGLVSEGNPTLRSFCARCLNEFLGWSGKNLPANSKAVPPAATALLERIVSYAGHSSCAKRFGAALAFSHCYKTFRENSAVVDVFTIDLIVTFTKSLALCHRDPPGFGSTKAVELCLLHLARIVEKYAKTLISTASRRRVPVELDEGKLEKEATLEKLTTWMLMQACRPELACRMSSWALVGRFLLALKNATSGGYFFENLARSKGPGWPSKAFFCGGFDPDKDAARALNAKEISSVFAVQDSHKSATETLKRLAAVVDCFTMSFDKVYVKADDMKNRPEWKVFGDCLSEFIDKVVLRLVTDPASLLATESLRTIIGGILIRLTDLIMTVHTKYGRDGIAVLPPVVASKSFADIIVRMVLDPKAVGFDLHEVDRLPRQMSEFLKATTTKVDALWTVMIRQAVTLLLEKPEYDMVELLRNSGKLENVHLLVAGFTVLHEASQTELVKDYLQTKKLTSEQFATKLIQHVNASLTMKYANSGSRKEAWISTDVSQEKALFSLALQCQSSGASAAAFCISSHSTQVSIYSKLRSVVFTYLFPDTALRSSDQRQRLFFYGLIGGDAEEHAGTWRSRHAVLKDALEYVCRNRPARKRYETTLEKLVMQSYGSFVEARPDEVKKDMDTVRSVLGVIKLLLQISQKTLKTGDAEVKKLYDFYISVLLTPIASDPQGAATKNRALTLLAAFLDGANGAVAETAMHEMCVNDFPLKAAELPKGSPQLAFYLQAVGFVLAAVEECRSIGGIEICIKLVCRDAHHPLLERCRGMFEAVVANDHSENVQKIFEIPWKIFTTPQYGPDHRRTAVEEILLPMLQAATSTARMDFFSRTMKDMITILDTKERSTTAGLLIVQTCCFSLLELLCVTLSQGDLTSPTSKVVLAFCAIRDQPAVTGKELIQFVTRCANEFAHKNVASEPGMEEVRRLFHCAAYRTLAAAVTATPIALKFYHLCLFEQNAEKGKILWANLVDLKRQYTFEVEFIQAPRKKKQLAAIHKEAQQDGSGKNGGVGSSSLSFGIFTSTSYASARLASASLVQGSSFNDEMSRYDYSEGLDRTSTPLAAREDAMGTIELEMDALNQHEVMATLVGLVQHMVEKKITPTVKDPLDNPSPPAWISALAGELKSSTAHLNVKLFLAKLIMNVENVSSETETPSSGGGNPPPGTEEPGPPPGTEEPDPTLPYFYQFAELFYGPLLDLLMEIDCTEGMNYFAVDLIHLLLKWSVKTPLPGGDQFRAQRVFLFLIQHVKHSNSQVQRNNLTLLKVLTEAWKAQLEIPPRGTIPDLLIKDKTKAKLNIPVINIIAIILNAGLPLTAGSFEEFLKILMLHLQESSKPLYSVSGLTLGLLFSRAEGAGIAGETIEAGVEALRQFLSGIVATDRDKFVAVLHQASKSYPAIVAVFQARILFLMPTLPGVIKAHGLDVLLAGADAMADPYRDFKSCGIFACLKDGNETVQGLTVEVLRKVAPRISASDLAEVLLEMVDLGSHGSPLMRQKYYEFCMYLYERFENSTVADEQTLLQIIRTRLFTGLKDRDKTIKDLLTAFWAQEKRMSGSTFMRLMTIFTSFITPELETAFLPTACHLLLGLCQKSTVFRDTKLFRTALTECDFFKQEIATSWKQRSTMAPITASTFSSGTFTSASYGSGSGSRNGAAPIFTPTQALAGPANDTLAVAGFTYSSQFAESLLIDLSRRGLITRDEHTTEISRLDKEMDTVKRRFQRDSNSDSSNKSFFIKREYSRRRAIEETLKNERERRSLDVTLTRSYRIGDVPDIEISYEAVIQPLRNLAERDVQTSSLLLRNLFGGIVAQARTKSEKVDEELEKLAKRLEGILKHQNVTDTTFLSTLLNIILQDSPKESKLLESVSAAAVTSAAAKSSQPNLGIAVLENAILLQSAEPEQKRARQKASVKADYWLGMYQLLQSDGQTDSIAGLQLDTVFKRSDEVLSAIQMEARGAYHDAADLYGQLINTRDDDSTLAVLQESHIRCLNELGNWKQLRTATIPLQMDQNSQSSEDMTALWDNNGHVETMLPYALRATFNLIFENSAEQEKAGDALDAFIKDAMEISGRRDFLQRKFGFELFIYQLLASNLSEADFFLNTHAVKNWLEEWAGTTQLNLQGRRKQLPMLQLMTEARRYLDVRHQIAHSPQKGRELSEQFHHFLANSEREAYANDPVGVGNDLATLRCYYSHVLASQPKNRLSEALMASFRVHEKLAVARTAIRQNNFDLSQRLLTKLHPVACKAHQGATFFSGNLPLRRLEDRWGGTFAAAAIAKSRSNKTPQQAQSNFAGLMQSLGLIDKLHGKSTAANAVPLRSLEADILLAVADTLHDFGSSVSLETADRQRLGLSSGTDVKPLYVRVFSEFAEACERAVDAVPFLRTFQYCDQLLRKGILDDVVLVERGTASLLKAIKLGSVEARDLFCRLLVWLREHPNIEDAFQVGCADIPAWMFIQWANQVLALLDKPEGNAVHDILGRMASEYPQAIIYGFKISKENYVFDEKDSRGRRNKKFFDELSEKLDIPLIDDLIRHLTRLCEPHTFFQDFTKRADYLLKYKKKDQLKQEYAEINQCVFRQGSSTQLAATWKEFVEKFKQDFVYLFGENGQKIANLSSSQWAKTKEKWENDFKEYGKKARETLSPRGRLADLNPWLAAFTSLQYGRALEIPGQYDGRERPRPETHVKITSFGDQVLTLASIRRPRRIIIRGDDEKDYPFLVKGGEDLRLDQRIEQLFVLMNRVFDQNPECAQRRLQIRTYKVVPMTTQVGIIEWVQGAMPLKEFLDKAQSPQDKVSLETASFARYDLIRKQLKISDKKAIRTYAGGEKERLISEKDLNNRAFLEVKPADMRKIFQQVTRPLDPLLLRRQLQRLTVSPDAFIIVRNLFAQAFGVMSIGQYVLGIGDRHLSNCMVSTETGLIFPIDFGHAFGSGVQSLPIAELAPIRLTRQFFNLMAPQCVKGLLQQTMVHAMRALRAERQILLATMDVFIQEPSMDWLQAARKQSPTDADSQEELLWYPREKIDTAERKLRGGNPAFITRTEVRSNTFLKSDQRLLAKVEDACIGDADGVRAKHGDRHLEVEAQIECLIDQSTDENILGRLFSGWNPWV
ncbi:DNA-dependent protein kinase catalytic subunit [Hypsibius exemplaris]|uniref:DNA-dependent protein kinase catalytic subunit n=1 Tax=Hypsibius exemplaris TaxID=2072580 RepID=A0A9X6RJI1_HYPEX|nr:DNA-dependent protein kinase catalytic subunit [Hypsibius exemplaris]